MKFDHGFELKTAKVNLLWILLCVICATALLFGGCVAPPRLVNRDAPVWKMVERPLDIRSHCMGNGSDCVIFIDGFWRSVSGIPGSELISPSVDNINCEKITKVCRVSTASVRPGGKLEVDVEEFAVTLWNDNEVLASATAGACAVGEQIVIDLQSKTVNMRVYPTDSSEACKAFSQVNTYALHGGYWRAGN
jgi:hypothetical protein